MGSNIAQRDHGSVSTVADMPSQDGEHTEAGETTSADNQPDPTPSAEDSEVQHGYLSVSADGTYPCPDWDCHSGENGWGEACSTCGGSGKIFSSEGPLDEMPKRGEK